jgi:hypothetical protein
MTPDPRRSFTLLLKKNTLPSHADDAICLYKTHLSHVSKGICLSVHPSTNHPCPQSPSAHPATHAYLCV